MTSPAQRIRRRPERGAAPPQADPRPAPAMVQAPSQPTVLLLLALIAIVLVWSYSSPIWYLMQRWWNEPDYTYGFLVPPFAGYLLWHRRAMIQAIDFRGSRWGYALLAVAAAMRWGSVYLFLNLPDPLSIVPCLLGVALVVGGWPALRWVWPAVLFLGFMVPVPGQLAGILSHPLQRVGAIVSTAVIQTLGIPAVARGNIIVLAESELGVAEACNGLPMMMLFFAVCFGTVFLSDRTWIEKGIILAAAAPIAVLANVIRISTTAVLYQMGGVELGNTLFHDFAGWFMMPLAVVLLWILLWILDHALVTPAADRPLVMNS